MSENKDENEVKNESHYLCIRKMCSPFGWTNDPNIVGYVLYEAGARVTTYNFAIFSSLLINDLGDQAYGDGNGKVLWGYVTTAYAITTVFSYLAIVSLVEYEDFKRTCLIKCGMLAGILHLLYIFCFSGGSVYLAMILVVLAKTLVRICDVAFDSMLDSISATIDSFKIGVDTHQVSLRASITGYLGMLGFLFFVIPVLAIIYGINKKVSSFLFKPLLNFHNQHTQIQISSLWLQSLVPIFCIGIWYLSVLRVVSILLPINALRGPKSPLKKDENYLSLLYQALRIGSTEQLNNLTYIQTLPDLGLFLLALIFLQGGAATAQGVAIILATDELDLSLAVVGAAGLVGIISAIIGTFFFKYLHKIDWLRPIQIIFVNIGVLILCALFVLIVYHTVDVFILAIVSGFQVGSIGAFTRSIVSSLTPHSRQTR